MYQNSPHKNLFLPTSQKEIEALGWDSIDVIIFSGDAYIDHPSFGTAIIGRFLESLGVKVAIVSQPNWLDDLRDFKKFGKPNLFFAVTAGNMDSMVNHYTAQKRLRSNDAYTPQGRTGQRPDYAITVYTHILKKLYPESLVIIGGIEASLRRLTHYDYWSNKLKPSVLFESGADFLLYGMAEQTLKAVIEALTNKDINSIKNIRQLAYLLPNDGHFKLSSPFIELPSHSQCIKDKRAFANAFVLAEKEYAKLAARTIVQKVFDKTLIINPPFSPISEDKLDYIYQLPFTRKPHFRYKNKTIPAFEMIKNSLTVHRGCFGGCSFCAIGAHQGKHISSRSQESVLNELHKIAQAPDFKGHISDLGGPSANMYGHSSIDKNLCLNCQKPSCLHPDICKNLNTSHEKLIALYKRAVLTKNVKKITIGSGIRYDILVKNINNKKGGYKAYTELLLTKHVSGRLKVAPEHTHDEVLNIMRKPSYTYFLAFSKIFNKINTLNNLKLQLVPYFISAHPGSNYNNMAELSLALKDENMSPEQVQDFTPTPMTLSSVMFYTGLNPYTGEKIYTATDLKEKGLQKQFFFYKKSEYKDSIKNLLKRISRHDLMKRLYDNSKKKDF